MMVTVKGKRIDLKTPTKKDIAQVVKHLDDDKISRWTENIPYPYRKKHGEEFVKLAADCLKKKDGYELFIHEKDKKDVIGGICLKGIDPKHKKAELGYWIGRKYWKKGYGTEAVRLVLDFGFRKLRLRRIWARVAEPNKASIRLLEKTGFRHEGVLRKNMWKRGRLHDEIRFGMLKEEHEKD